MHTCESVDTTYGDKLLNPSLHGTIKVTAKTAQCQNQNVGDIAASRFHPLIAGQGDQSEGFSFVYNLGGVGYNLQNHVLDTTFRTVVTGGLGWGGVYTQQTSHFAKIQVLAHATVTASTQLLVLKGKIQRPDDDPGGLACVIDFTATYVKEQ